MGIDGRGVRKSYKAMIPAVFMYTPRAPRPKRWGNQHCGTKYRNFADNDRLCRLCKGFRQPRTKFPLGSRKLYHNYGMFASYGISISPDIIVKMRRQGFRLCRFHQVFYQSHRRHIERVPIKYRNRHLNFLWRRAVRPRRF